MISSLPPSSDVTERLVRGDRLIVATGLLLVTSLAWWYMLVGAGMDMGNMDMRMPMPWSADYAALVFFMWWIMMVAMMLPSAAPMILLFALVNRRNRAVGSPNVSTTIFAAGYLGTWGVFCLLATGLHWLLDQAGLLSPQMASPSSMLGGLLLVLAGTYQLSPYKHACLRHCRGPMEFVTRYWKPGNLGALQMAGRHGFVCVGCCWLAMGLLFYGGVMNLQWIVGLAVLVLLEKLLPAGHSFSFLSGIIFIAWGLGLWLWV
jgi:predicted metal-binding membrane protein